MISSYQVNIIVAGIISQGTFGLMGKEDRINQDPLKQD